MGCADIPTDPTRSLSPIINCVDYILVADDADSKDVKGEVLCICQRIWGMLGCYRTPSITREYTIMCPNVYIYIHALPWHTGNCSMGMIFHIIVVTLGELMSISDCSLHCIQQCLHILIGGSAAFYHSTTFRGHSHRDRSKDKIQNWTEFRETNLTFLQKQS